MEDLTFYVEMLNFTFEFQEFENTIDKVNK